MSDTNRDTLMAGEQVKIGNDQEKAQSAREPR